MPYTMQLQIIQAFLFNIAGGIRKKELEVKHDGARYHVSPWGLLWNDGNYYLIGYDHDTQVKDIRHYRVDKMKNIPIENKVREGRGEA